MAIQNNFPAIKPTLLLDFANTKALDPRITFTRASTATFYGTQTAKAEENLLLRSQDYSATWTVTNLTPVTGKTAPDATTTATEFTASAGNATLTQAVTAIAGDYTFSVFLRRVSGAGNVDISAHSGGTWVTQTLTSTWTRFTVTQTLTAGSRTPGIRVVTSGDVIEVWGAQLEQRSAVTAYTATTTQPITNYIPVLQTAASGVARFDHNPTTFESLGLEIEEQRTNLLTYSEQFDDAAWTKTNATITANTIVAPDGALTGDSIFETTATGSHRARTASISVSASTSYTCTVFAKLGFGAARFLGIGLSSTTDITTGARRSYVFDLSNGTATTTGGATWTVVSGSATAVGNGWYRCQMAVTTDAAASTMVVSIGLSNTFSAATFTSGYTGDGYSGVYIWGAQLEAGAFPTSYIQTVASQVTRAADAASMTGTNFSSWYNAGEGTLYGEYANSVTPAGGVARRIAHISDGTDSNRIYTAWGETTARALLVCTANGVSQASISGTAMSASGGKLAGAYKVNDFAVSANGLLTGTDTDGIIPSVNVLHIGTSAVGTSSHYLNGCVKKIAYYPLRVTNANLQALTS